MIHEHLRVRIGVDTLICEVEKRAKELFGGGIATVEISRSRQVDGPSALALRALSSSIRALW